MTTPRTVHVVMRADPSEHRASRTCACGPAVEHDLEDPRRLVYLHQCPQPEEAEDWGRIDAENRERAAHEAEEDARDEHGPVPGEPSWCRCGLLTGHQR